jgi:hypothetical protein
MYSLMVEGQLLLYICDAPGVQPYKGTCIPFVGSVPSC